MKALYLDTSVLVSAVTAEPETNRVQAWLAQRRQAVAVSDWTLVEVASALSFKFRVGQLQRDEHAAAADAFATYVQTADVASVTREHFRSAAAFLGSPELSLRAPDALHLAVCSERGDTLVTRDRRMAEAATTLGVDVQLL